MAFGVEYEFVEQFDLVRLFVSQLLSLREQMFPLLLNFLLQIRQLLILLPLQVLFRQHLLALRCLHLNSFSLANHIAEFICNFQISANQIEEFLLQLLNLS